MLKVWIIGGVALIALELIIPGAVLAPLGMGALVVALLVWLGVLEQWIPALTTWFIVSLGLIVVVRLIVNRLMPGDEEWSPTDEDVELFDQVVEVVETIEKGKQGRIQLRGSSWPATCYEDTLPAGSRAKIFYRDGLTWVVTPALEHTLDSAPPPARGDAGA